MPQDIFDKIASPKASSGQGDVFDRLTAKTAPTGTSDPFNGQSPTGSAALDTVARAGATAMKQQMAGPLAASAQPTLNEDLASVGAGSNNPLHFFAHPLDALAGVGVLAKHFGQFGQQTADLATKAGQHGDVPPAVAGALSFPGHAVATMGRIGEGLASPQNVALAAASAHPAVRIPAAIYGAVTSGKSMLDAAGSNAPLADRLEQGLLGLAGMAGSGAMGASGVKGTFLKRPPLEADAAVTNIRNAVNPVPQDAPGFIKNLTDQLDTVMSHKSGVPVNDLASLTKHFESAAQADPYRAQLIEPFKNELTSRASSTNPETIGSLDQRLSDINKDLQPKYMRGPDGSVQQVAAVGAEQARALQAEAAQIRNQLGQEISKRTGIPPDQVIAARKNYGQLNDLRDTAQWYANEAQRTQNVAAAKPPDTHITAAGIANKVLQKGVRKWQDAGATPRTPGALLQRTFEGYSPEPPAPLQPTPQPSLPGPQQPPGPLRQAVIAARQTGSGGGGVPAVVQQAISPTPAIPATEPGLLRPGTGPQPPASSPLPYGPEGRQPALMRTPVRPTVGQENPEISPLSLGARQGSLIEDYLKTLTAHDDAVLPEPVRNVVQNNASGESAASQEALNRAASEKASGTTRVRIDTRSGRETPLFGPDAVDTKAGPYDRIVQRGPGGETTLDEGRSARPIAPRAPLAPAEPPMISGMKDGRHVRVAQQHLAWAVKDGFIPDGSK